FQAEDGIRDRNVTGVQTCALPIFLTEAGTDFSQVVKFTIYLKSMDTFAAVNEIYGGYLEKPYPARATVEVSRLPKDVLVEMDVRSEERRVGREGGCM